MRVNSVVASNEGEYYGGGITNLGDLLVENSTIIGNQGYLGGGIANVSGEAVVRTSSLSGNHADSIGGGWSNHNTGNSFVFEASASLSGNTSGSGNYAGCYDVDGHGACTQ